MKNKFILPVVTINKSRNGYEVTWDYRGSEAELVLFRNESYIEGYIAGALELLKSSSTEIICFSALTGTVRRLTESSAEKLHDLVKNILHSYVIEENRKIEKEENFPHIKFHKEARK